MSKTVAQNISASSTVFPILFAISVVHLLNDTMQSTVSALFPILKQSLHLSFSQVGLIAFSMSITASLLQPVVGLATDIRPRPYILPVGVCFTLLGIVSLSLAPSFKFVVLAVISMGVGSAIFHPESSRVAYLASGGRRGLAQAIFQVGGNLGSSLGPIITALVFVPLGQIGVIWFAFVAIAAIVIQYFVAGWYKDQQTLYRPAAKQKAMAAETLYTPGLSRRKVALAIAVLIGLIFSKYVYLSSITSYYTFYLIHRFGVSIPHSQLFLFAFLASTAVGVFLGGPITDRFGRRNMIWFSILGTAPFSILMPHANLIGSGILVVCAGLVLSSAFSIIVVYAQELLPGRVGLVSGLFFGLAFGLGGLGSTILGSIADATSIAFIMKICAYLPLLGMMAVMLPKDKEVRQQ